LLAIPGGCAKNPCSEEVLKNKLHYIKMNGREVFKFSVKVLGETTEESLKKAGLTPADLDWLIPHQANIRIIETGAERLGIPIDKVAINIHKYGNTSTASIPLALEELVLEGKIKDGDILALVGFGAGLSWGSAVLRWKNIES